MVEEKEHGKWNHKDLDLSLLSGIYQLCDLKSHLTPLSLFPHYRNEDTKYFHHWAAVRIMCNTISITYHRENAQSFFFFSISSSLLIAKRKAAYAVPTSLLHLTCIHLQRGTFLIG